MLKKQIIKREIKKRIVTLVLTISTLIVSTILFFLQDIKFVLEYMNIYFVTTLASWVYSEINISNFKYDIEKDKEESIAYFLGEFTDAINELNISVIEEIINGLGKDYENDNINFKKIEDKIGEFSQNLGNLLEKHELSTRLISRRYIDYISKKHQ